MKSGASDYDSLYAQTPSQAEGERDEPSERSAMEQHPDVPRTEPSQAEGERREDDQAPRRR
ncbi:hypothetical protein ACFOZ0_07630 [Streptomyces yaanensis]|uniref:Uncharacterized protein n=1 Tax=Streptomyces yaanensis TaxID=1142239 RepID=A0ABV7S9J0_9ACTN|nr:hypothetical protein [Streptomyces sp. CGMCC 4.7035]WNC02652.1 hypothetical protein Q2K21_33900 [Streptomyces sp. CGMCC 4.7035]